MKNILVLLLITFLSQACSQTKVVSKDHTPSNSEVENNSQKVFKMGILGHSIIDPSLTSESAAQNLINELKPQLMYDVIYNQQAVATVMYDKQKNVTSRTVFNYREDKMYEFLYTGSGNYYTVLPGRNTASRTTQDSAYFKRIFKIDPSNKKEILGFDCEHVKIMDPIVSRKVIAKAYYTKDIPYVTKGFGHLGKLIEGLPLETTMTIQGLEIVTGAMEHKHLDEKSRHLELNLENYQELSYNAFNLMREKL